MRALLDANVYISFLLTRSATTPPRLVVNAALDGAYKLLLTAGLIDEVRRKTATKPYLASRITQTEVERLVRALAVIAEFVPELEEPLPEVGVTARTTTSSRMPWSVRPVIWYPATREYKQSVRSMVY